MDRITIKHLDAIAARLNSITGSPQQAYTDGKANVGNFHISRAYGGYALHRMSNEHGGVSQPMGHDGHVSARELYNKMHAFIRGIEFAAQTFTTIR